MGAVSKIGGTAVDTFSPYTGMVGGLLMNSMLSGVVDELGGGKFANGAVTGSFSYLFNDTLHRVQDRGDSDDSGSMLATAIGIAVPLSAVDGPLPIGDIISAALLTAAAGYDFTQRIYVTYTLVDDYGRIYIGRASGFGNPYSVMMKRYYGHHKKKDLFHSPILDRWALGYKGYEAIRGREQQLLDFWGGVGCPFVGNSIRAVWRYNPQGRLFHYRANTYFGNIAPYTGF